MGEFTARDAIEPRWDPALKQVAIRRFLMIAGALAGLTVVGLIAINLVGLGRNPLAILIAVVGPASSAVASALIAGIIAGHAIVGRILLKMAFPIFVGALVGLVLFTWAFALAFEYTDQIVAAQSVADREVRTLGGGELTVGEIVRYMRGGQSDGDAATGWLGIPAGVLWVLQFRIVRDFLLAFGALGFVSLTASFAIWWERKVAGRIQSRLGPMRVGGWHGWAQSIADGLKLVQKEDIVLAGADKPLFKLAPYLVFIPVLAAFIALPFGASWAFRDLDVALIFILSMVGIDVVGIILGGWASNNKWSVYGAMRVACQMVSYEIPMGMSLLVPVMTVGTLKLTAIGEAQSGGFHTWLVFANPFTFIAALVYFISSLASVKRAPFDLPEAESELVAGFHTEYSGFRWAVFFFGEYAAMFVVSGVATVLFFGAWHSPLPAHWGASLLENGLWGRAVYGLLFSGPVWFVFKAYFLLFVQIWLRWTLPRVRIDQVMYACVQVLLPVTLAILLGNTLWQLFVVAGSVPAVVVNLVLTAIGAVLVAGFVAISAYGYANRRRLVGTLVTDHLPGS
ncbi:MAG TPA: NADH-quinone oxidoreductase subunit NuoH [Phycisphaerae bacterium]|nr:NADH-quinone oxidoreductase subunit NuoH [Phycisphaerae bacterium]HOJ73578.1 NADH-quinone oxidoreductase subunit NuoH [Phycisphaerae bacterium]HOM51613.1 NADH-quinone oxidoreductase subunit NuoH [Phycisphaerae bacterium]HOQ85246.1 NADH-quinone oxidoreductase subunit NuoH [Phycisphaerae bacterium]HPP25585.1 NADH-quinone oxidoreductase subunit NuoH [Phycisphaerae bacterium]